MRNAYAIACFRAALIGALVVFLRANLLSGMAPDTWTAVPT